MKIGELITVKYWDSKLDYTPLSEKLFHLDSTHEFWWLNNEKPYFMEIPKGFIWDGATIFRIFWSILGYSRSGMMLKPSAPHDYIYVNKGWIYNHLTKEMEFVSRKHSDQLFYKHLVANGIPEKKARLCYQFIRFFGRLYWRDFSDWMPSKRKINK